ncbi:MAG: hypothetical protein FWF92_07090 [Oscillospiraceae bacterium]|nr:hypothetical protein [Oscillospiraceae bacterium]
MKSKLKSVVSIIALNAFLITITVYFLLQYTKTAGNSIETERADMEIRQDIVEIYGYIFRNEEIIYSIGGNSVNYLVDNGVKVGKNQLVALSQQNSADFSMKDQITALTEKLDILNKSNINLEFVTTNIEKINRDSHSMYLNMLQSIENGRFKDAGKSRTEFLILLNKKQLITGEISGSRFENIINSAEEKKSLLESQMSVSGIGASEVYSNKSGIFYARVDGYENSFTADIVKTLDFDKFDELIKKDPDSNILNNALGKVAYDFNWYLICKTQKNKTFDFTDGKKYDIIYPYSSNRTIESVLIRQIGGADSDEIILIFETAAIPFDFDFSRKQTIQIVFNEISGIKVPEEAIHIIEREDGTAAEGVYIQKGNLVVFRELPKNECLAKFDGYYLYLEPSKRPETGGGKLQLYEDIITAGKNLYDGKAID